MAEFPTATPLDRAFSLLHFLADRAGKGARVPEICAHLGTHRVSAHRLIKFLTELGYVSQAADLSYHLGFEAWALGLNSAARFIPATVTRAMKRICGKTDECVYLMRKSALEGVCIAYEEGRSPIRALIMQIGTRRTLGIGAASQAILMQMPAAETAKTINCNAKAYARDGQTADDIGKMVSTARRHGYAFSQGQIVAESRSLAVPLPAVVAGTEPLSMSIITFESRIQGSRRNELVNVLRDEVALLAKA